MVTSDCFRMNGPAFFLSFLSQHVAFCSLRHVFLFHFSHVRSVDAVIRMHTPHTVHNVLITLMHAYIHALRVNVLALATVCLSSAQAFSFFSRGGLDERHDQRFQKIRF